MRLKQYLILMFLFSFAYGFSQPQNMYVVTFTDKNNSSHIVSKPETFLSSKAIEKRMRLNIPITEEDLPINENYIDFLKTFSAIKIVTQSKWMNYVVITCNNQLLLETLKYITFINKITQLHEIDYNNLDIQFTDRNYSFFNQLETFHDTTGLAYYGKAAKQIGIHNGHYLHQLGYKGDNMLIVMLDNGYNSLDTLEFFSDFFQSNRFLGTHDAANEENYNIYRDGTHGTMVLSTMALNRPYTYVGTAPHADYFLIRTEMSYYEDILEEYYWAAGAEFADSLGADVVNSSLGYTTFDIGEQNHTFSDLNGKRSVASIAASKLAQKGCIVSISAGNQGDKYWRYISVPADAPDALCVAAMNTDSIVASFSSIGHAAFDYVKPDITSVGWNTAYCTIYDTLSKGNGTSFAAPVISGLSACLWQAFPKKSSLEIMEAIRQSSHLYNHSDSSYGYGIPDFRKAYRILSENSINEITDNHIVIIYPNPTSDYIYIKTFQETPDFTFIISDINGRKLSEHRSYKQTFSLDVSNLANGIYFITVKQANNPLTVRKFIKN